MAANPESGTKEGECRAARKAAVVPDHAPVMVDEAGGVLGGVAVLVRVSL